MIEEMRELRDTRIKKEKDEEIRELRDTRIKKEKIKR